MVSRLLFGICIALLMASALGEYWQSYGNMSESNITFINTTIKAIIGNMEKNVNGNGQAAAKNISDALNAAWAPAWNVVIYSTSQAIDKAQSVVYGYAYNEHWLWYNYYTINTSVIIWKDYNCGSWASLSS